MLRVRVASASERRLAWLVKRFEGVEDVDIFATPLLFDEPVVKVGIPVCLQTTDTCLAKAEAAASEVAMARSIGAEPPDLILVADTIVEDPDDPNVPLGKPEDAAQATTMLLRLSGTRHRVWSASAILQPPGRDGEHRLHGGWTANLWTESAVVEFDELSQDRLVELVSSGSWQGKAGAYDLAGAAAADAKLIEGEEVTVLGLAPSAVTALHNVITSP